MDGTIIVADDDRTIRTVISQALTRAGCRVRATGTISTMWRWLEEGEGDVLVTDVSMPDGDALEILPAILKKRPDLPILVMSAQNTVMTAIRAAEAGAFDYLPKPFDLANLLSLVNKATKQTKTRVTPPPEPVEPLPLIGRSTAMQEVYRVMSRLMATDLTVMITGASGTGKGIVAKALHDFSERKGKPFVLLNMASTPADLVEQELFGDGTAQGKLNAASKGTLFLDEVGDMPLAAQTSLLREMQENTIDDVRIIAATHHDLQALVIEGKFREDLFYRLNVVPIRLPNLIERIDDIDDLAAHFLAKAAQSGLPKKTLNPEAIEALRRHSWSGNVRELENLMKRLCILCSDGIITATDITNELDDAGASPAMYLGRDMSLSGSVEAHIKHYFDLHGDSLPPEGLYARIMAEVEKPLICLTLEATHGNQLKAAKLLGINRNTLRKKISELDIVVTRGARMM